MICQYEEKVNKKMQQRLILILIFWGVNTCSLIRIYIRWPLWYK